MQTELSLPLGINDYVDSPLEFLDILDDWLPREVCHYTSKEIALEKILSSKKLRLGDLASTNDPRECRNRLYFYSEWGNVSGVAKWQGNLENHITKGLKVLCTSCHNNPFWDFLNPDFTYIDHNEFGVSHSRMWAHYAGNHTGICLLFDARKLDKNIIEELKNKNCEVRHGFVKYDYEKSVGMIVADDSEFQNCERSERLAKSLMKHYDDNFLYKAPDWKSEHEFRWLVHTRDTSELFISIENAIKAVMVGVDFPKVYEPSLKVLCEQLGIPAGRINWELSGRPFINRYAIYKP